MYVCAVTIYVTQCPFIEIMLIKFISRHKLQGKCPKNLQLWIQCFPPDDALACGAAASAPRQPVRWAALVVTPTPETAIISEGCCPAPPPTQLLYPVVALREGQVWPISH